MQISSESVKSFDKGVQVGAVGVLLQQRQFLLKESGKAIQRKGGMN